MRPSLAANSRKARLFSRLAHRNDRRNGWKQCEKNVEGNPYHDIALCACETGLWRAGELMLIGRSPKSSSPSRRQRRIPKFVAKYSGAARSL
jgi:hypothetical protein